MIFSSIYLSVTIIDYRFNKRSYPVVVRCKSHASKGASELRLSNRECLPDAVTMALITHPSQGLYQTVSSRHKWNQGIKHDSFVAFQLIDRTNTITSLKQHFNSRFHHINTSKRNHFQILYFKGNSQNVKSDHSDSSSKLTDPPVKLSHAQEDQVKAADSADVHNYQITYSSENKQSATTGSLAIKKLFMKWILMLQTQAADPENVILVEKTVGSNKSEESQVTLKGKAGQLLKSTAVNFMKLDASISLPLLIIVPLYLTVRMAYGAEVTKELTPLWVLGPFIIALYVKIIQALCSLYVFCFMSAVKVVKKLPSYYSLISNYISEGKLKEYIWFRFIKPIEDVMNMNFKHFFARKMKQLQEWAVEKYLDYVESIWPFYCRTIRFLKKANLI